jgi:hypothetical protein
MNGGICGRDRPRRAGVLAAMVAGIAVLTAACGGGSGNSAGSPGQSNLQMALSYAKCMRAHGAPNWPDPNSQGQFVKTSANRADLHAPSSAGQACRHLLPNGGRITAAGQKKITALALQFAACMRSHGITNFPDPATGSSGFEFMIPNGLNPQSPQVQAASQACQNYQHAAGKYIPPG